jgi:hypothetical protein
MVHFGHVNCPVAKDQTALRSRSEIVSAERVYLYILTCRVKWSSAMNRDTDSYMPVGDTGTSGQYLP